MYRNSTGANYPYNIGNMINITGSSATQPSYYYFYYNIDVEAKCFDVTSISDSDSEKHLIGIFDLYGKPVNVIRKTNQIIIYVYSDGSVEKRLTVK